MRSKYLKYLGAFTIPAVAVFSLLSVGWLTFLPLLYVFGLLPLVELLGKPSRDTLSVEEEKILLHSWYFDALLYLMAAIQFASLFLFLHVISLREHTWLEMAGKISAMGILCGVLGINVAHELGHRKELFHHVLSQLLLATSLYMHFFIEHNRGHHKRVATGEDPATARYGENVYAFWWRSVTGSWISAWEIEAARQGRSGQPTWTIHNQMIVFLVVQLMSIGLIGLVFGPVATLAFIAAAVFGFLLLETVNYIEHYGLERSKAGNKTFERVMPWHSWNSEHPLGRIMLFELSRHSDHHFQASRKYQVLRYQDQSPQMPTGYPGMMLLSLLPILWFSVMNPKVALLKRENPHD